MLRTFQIIIACFYLCLKISSMKCLYGQRLYFPWSSLWLPGNSGVPSEWALTCFLVARTPVGCGLVPEFAVRFQFWLQLVFNLDPIIWSGSSTNRMFVSQFGDLHLTCTFWLNPQPSFNYCTYMGYEFGHEGSNFSSAYLSVNETQWKKLQMTSVNSAIKISIGITVPSAFSITVLYIIHIMYFISLLLYEYVISVIPSLILPTDLCLNCTPKSLKCRIKLSE